MVHNKISKTSNLALFIATFLTIITVLILFSSISILPKPKLKEYKIEDYQPVQNYKYALKLRRGGKYE